MTLDSPKIENDEEGPSTKKQKTLENADADSELSKVLPLDDEVKIEPSDDCSGSHMVGTTVRYPKRKCVAMLMSFYGKDFFGMQVTRTDGCPGIEDVFCRHLVEAGLIKEEDYVSFGKMHFQRSCRTDKHVSAARQVISFKMSELPNAVQLINALLPKSIRVHDFVRTTKGFDCKKWASSRIYNYIVPSYCFQHKDKVNTEQLKEFRADETLVNRINEILKQYYGTKNFHNFTSRKEGKDPSASRYITSFKVSETFLWPVKTENDETVEQTEFFTLSVHGQSFMLHQIRKMIGLAMAVVRGNTSEELYDKIFTKDKYDIPKAPSIGLYLENVFFEYYNKKFGKDGMHQPVEWSHCLDEVEKFKREQIVHNLLTDINKERIYEEYLPILDLHTYTTEIGHRLTRPDKSVNVENANTSSDNCNQPVSIISNTENSGAINDGFVSET